MTDAPPVVDEDLAARLLNEIGIILASDTEYTARPTLLYAEVAPNVVGPSIYKDAGNVIVYRRVPETICDILLALWNRQQSDSPWGAMEYVLRDKQFKVTYRYPGDPDWSDDLDYRETVVRRYFGNKPIVYPPLRSDLPGLTFKL